MRVRVHVELEESRLRCPPAVGFSWSSLLQDMDYSRMVERLLKLAVSSVVSPTLLVLGPSSGGFADHPNHCRSPTTSSG